MRRSSGFGPADRLRAAVNVLASLGAILGAMLASSVFAQGKSTLVLTELAPLYSMTASLGEGTSIDVKNVPAEGRRMNALGRYLEKPRDADLAILKQADAVVTIGKLWRESPLYVAARAQNLRVVNVDATEPYSTTLSGVALMRELPGHAPWIEPQSAGSPPTSVYCWLSPSNGVRMAEIIAQDLARLSPRDTQRIAQNLVDFRRALLDLKEEYETKFSGLEALSVFALSGDFVYLLTDLGMFVDGTFIKQDIEWTDEDLRSFSNYLRARNTTVVIHKWEPSPSIKQAIESAGAQLAVLKTGEEGVVSDGALSRAGYLADLRMNLESIYQAGHKAVRR